MATGAAGTETRRSTPPNSGKVPSEPDSTEAAAVEHAASFFARSQKTSRGNLGYAAEKPL